MNGQRVLVTRPEPGASRTATRLRAAGHVPVVLPLSEVRPAPPARIEAKDFAAVAAALWRTGRRNGWRQAAALVAGPDAPLAKAVARGLRGQIGRDYGC